MKDTDKSKEKLKKLYKAAIGYYELLTEKQVLAGAALTPYKCLRCDKEKIHCNTLTPLICDKCVEEIKNEI